MSSAHITPNTASKRAIKKAIATPFSSFLTCQTNTLVLRLWLAISSAKVTLSTELIFLNTSDLTCVQSGKHDNHIFNTGGL